MVEHGGYGGRTEGITPSISDVLSRLKSTGAALLVVGDLPPTLYAHACQQMMGDQLERTRRRLFVSTTGDLSTPMHCQSTSAHDSDSTRVRFIRHETDQRSTTAARIPADDSLSTSVVEGGYSELGIEISKTIEDFAEAADGLAPADFRLCFDSLIPLLSNGRQTAFQFLHVLIGRLKSVGGMGHFHLPRPLSSQDVSVFRPLFDAVIELRLHDGTIQRRWHLQNEAVTTQWLSPTANSNQ